jgi:D-serine deaminase-like pyridoxal phosphate-dependent protein
VTVAREPTLVGDGEREGAESPHLATPALLVDRTILTRNIAAMAGRAAAANVTLWPHAKTHKSPQIAREQLSAGAEGITVATISEAETMVAAGVKTLLLAYPPVDSWRLERIAALGGTANLTVTLDDLDTVHMLDAACRAAGVGISFLWEVDCGNRRCGSRPGVPTADLVERAVTTSAHARYSGLMTFPGHAYGARNDQELAAIARAELEAVSTTAAELSKRGIDSPVLSIGSTPTVRHLSATAAGMQIRPGNYVFNDATQVALGVASVNDCALTVLTAVISRPSRDRVILDSGSKALSGERMTERTDGFGIVAGAPDMRIERLFEEHAIARVDPRTSLAVGSRVRVIPNHACTTANLHASMLLMDGGQIVDIWPIAARGWS